MVNAAMVDLRQVPRTRATWHSSIGLLWRGCVELR
jgi:hypothetical protein